MERPLFIIPKENNQTFKKTGGGNPPKFIGSRTSFSRHKRQRVQELQGLIDFRHAKIRSPGERLFYEVEFHEKAVSKSAQPLHLLQASNIDIYAQVSENTFLATSTKANLRSFKDTVNRLTLRNKNDSAYLSAITRIKPISKEDRVIGRLEGEEFKGFLFLHHVLSVEECEEVNREISKETKREHEFFITESGSKAIYGIFPSNFIDEISHPAPDNPIYKIEQSLDFIIPQEFAQEYSFEGVRIENAPDGVLVGVFDSGVKDNPIYRDSIIGNESFISDKQNENISHGTFVGTRIIFGNNIESQIAAKVLNAGAKILNIQILEGNTPTPEKQIVDAVKSVIERLEYQNIKIFNLSLNSEIPIDTNHKSFVTRELDAMAYKHKVLFVISAGNHSVFRNATYPGSFLLPDAVIAPPADILTGVSVGSIADTGSTRAIALQGEPSPFSRVGLSGMRKPELTHFGGNCDNNNSSSGIGVKGFSADPNKITEGCGTSFSAPLVSRIAAQIYAYLRDNGWNTATIELTKALLLHSGDYQLPATSTINLNDLHRITGFGMPDYDRALDCTKSNATFVYCDTIGKLVQQDGKVQKMSRHKIRFAVPADLEGRGKQIKVKGTLVYNPQISESGEKDYSLVDIGINLHYKNSRGRTVGGGLRNSQDNRTKWNSTKSFEKIYKAYQGGEWEIWLTLTARGRADVDEYIQDYALVITIEDVTPNADERVEVYNSVREQNRSYVPIETRIQI